MTPAAPSLDARTTRELYREQLALARQLVPDWAQYWPPKADEYFDSRDVGLVLFKLFAELEAYVGEQLNKAPDKYLLSFLSFLGQGLRAPKAARAPLAFTLVDPRATVVVPAETKVSAKHDSNLIFETDQPLLAVPAVLSAAFFSAPAQDSYADLSGRLVAASALPAVLVPVDHALYLADAALFKSEAPLSSLVISLEGTNLSKEWFTRWSDGQGNALYPQFDVDLYDRLVVSFADVAPLPASVVDGDAEPWIAARPAAGRYVLAVEEPLLPEIYSISISASATGIAPDATYCNAVAVDVKKGGAPFGQQPKVEDAFYVGSAAVFSRPTAMVELAFTVEPIAVRPAVTLAWEHWNGGGWSPLQVDDGTASLSVSGVVSFVCPVIPVVKINGKESCWVRARISAGSYGSAGQVVVSRPASEVVDQILAPYVTDKDAAIEALKENAIDFGYAYRPPSYAPPYLSSLSLAYSLVKRPARSRALNQLAYAPAGKRPYFPSDELAPAFHFGFASDGFAENVAGHPLTLYVAVDQGAYTPLQAAWYGSTQSAWVPLRAKDGTRGLSTSGIVELELPASLSPRSLFGLELCWLKLVLADGEADVAARVASISPNAVYASGAATWRNTILGAGTAEPGLQLRFPRAPVLDGQIVEVQAPRMPPAAEVEAVESEEGPNAIRVEHNLAGDVTAIWIRWHEVSSFDFSRPTDRHYTLRHDTGVISFGDGVRGMAPPTGRNNIVASFYRSGGGRQGNVAPGTLTTLDVARPPLKGVSNPEAAVGGLDVDGLDVLRTLGPRALKTQDRAVSGEDMVTLAEASSQKVARAGFYRDGSALVVSILPDEAGDRPIAPVPLLDEVREYIAARSLGLLRDRIRVVGPVYVPIDLRVSVQLSAGAAAPQTIAQIRNALAAYLNPLSGGPNGAGWSFTASIFASQLAAVVRGLSEVAAVGGLTIADDQTFRTMAHNELPALGRVDVEVEVEHGD